MTHHTKDKGNLGVTAIIFEATKQGWNVNLPISEHCSYDLIIEKNASCKRVQVRYSTPKNDFIQTKLRSCWADKNGSHVRLKKKGDYDILAIYNPKDNECYFIKDNDFDNVNNITLRLKEPKIKSPFNRFAKNYKTIK